MTAYMFLDIGPLNYHITLSLTLCKKNMLERLVDNEMNTYYVVVHRSTTCLHYDGIHVP